MEEKERGFESLDFYQDSLKLLKASYKLAGNLPNYERYNLSDQLRRASCSILLNVAEGYGRYHYLERLRFLSIARGSLSETLSAFIIAQNLGYCNDMQLNWSRELKIKIERNLNGYCRFIRKRKQGGSEYGNQYLKE